MTLIVYTLLFTGVIFFIYGVYLFTLINKDISKYKLPTFVINNVKPVCYSSIIIGICIIISCVYLLYEDKHMKLQSKSNFGFKFY